MKNSFKILSFITLVSILCNSCMGNFKPYDIGSINDTNIKNNDNNNLSNTDNKQVSDLDVTIESIDASDKEGDIVYQTIRYPMISCNNNQALNNSFKILNEKYKSDALKFKEEFKDVVRDKTMVPEPGIGYSYTIDADITKKDNKYLSLGVSTFIDSGGAHPSYFINGVTFDINTAKELSIYDFVKDKEELRAFIKKWVDEHQEEGIYEDAKDTVDKYIDNPPNEFGIDYKIDFYLNEDDVNVIFQSYELAPYAYGIIEITIDKNLLKVDI